MSFANAFRTGAGAAVLAVSLLQGGVALAQCPIPVEDFEPDPEFTSSFMLERCKFDTKGENPFFPLRPGWQIVLESDEEVVVITVLRETRKVGGIQTRIVEEFEYEKDGDELIPVERSLNFMAQCRQTGSVHYFGEKVFFFDDDGNPIPGTGGWQHKKNGALAGLIMPGTILVGGGYYQEIAPADSALDKGRIEALEESCEVGGFEFDQCVEIVDTSDCDPSSEDVKVYAAGIGNVVDEDLEVTRFGFVRRHRGGGDDDDDDDDDDD